MLYGMWIINLAKMNCSGGSFYFVSSITQTIEPFGNCIADCQQYINKNMLLAESSHIFGNLAYMWFCIYVTNYYYVRPMWYFVSDSIVTSATIMYVSQRWMQYGDMYSINPPDLKIVGYWIKSS